jgi:hypothetical protein
MASLGFLANSINSYTVHSLSLTKWAQISGCEYYACQNSKGDDVNQCNEYSCITRRDTDEDFSEKVYLQIYFAEYSDQLS